MHTLIPSRTLFSTVIIAAVIGLYVFSPFARALNSESVVFNRATAQYMAAPDSVSLDVTGDMTVEAWVKPQSVPAVDGQEFAIVAKYNNDTDKRSYYFRYLKDQGNVQLGALTSANGTNFTLGAVTYTLSTTTWTHVAFVCSGPNLTVYVNGSTIGTSSCEASKFNTDASLGIGAVVNNTSVHYFDGKMDDVRIWNTARTQTEIAADMNKELLGNEPGLVGYWRFNGGALEDATANNNDLTNVNGATFSPDVPFTGAIPPTEQASALIQAVEGYGFPKNIENALLANIKKLPDFIEEEQTDAALGQIAAFIEKVEKFYGDGFITQEQRDALIGMATALADVL